LRRLRDVSLYDELEARSSRLATGLADHGRVSRVGAMLTLFHADYAALFRHLLSRGIYVAPSQFEAMFVSLAHDDETIDQTIEAVADFVGDDRSRG
jgi:glutamate-1-semialdehyde 2,1-aminomutase